MSQTNSFYTEDELHAIGFKQVGNNVLISKRACFYGANNMRIGSNVRIDDFCILSGSVTIGNFVHVAPYTSLCGGAAGITVDDFANLSRKIEVFAVSDDFSGESMTNPMIPSQYKNITEAPVHIGKHVLIGASSVVLPGAHLGEGCVVGALSLVKENLLPWFIYAGIPTKKIKPRGKKILELEQVFLKQYSGD